MGEEDSETSAFPLSWGGRATHLRERTGTCAPGDLRPPGPWSLFVWIWGLGVRAEVRIPQLEVITCG